MRPASAGGGRGPGAGPAAAPGPGRPGIVATPGPACSEPPGPLALEGRVVAVDAAHRHRRTAGAARTTGPITPSSSRAVGPPRCATPAAAWSGGAPLWRRPDRAAPFPGPGRGRADRGPAHARRLDAAPRAPRPALPAARPSRAAGRRARALDDRDPPALVARRRPGRGPRPCARGA